MSPVIRAMLLAVLLLAALPAAASAGVLDPGDTTELAQALADARDEQDICYGWNVANNFSGTDDVGSSLGPGVPVRCPQYVELRGSIDYSCDSCEAQDSASISIESNLRNPPTTGDLKDLGLEASDLLGDKDDQTLFNMVQALPLITAQRGNAAFIAPELDQQTPTADRPTDHPGSDFWRDAWGGLLIGIVLIVAAVGWWLYQRNEYRRSTRPEGTVT
jgi:hypothetical protein